MAERIGKYLIAHKTQPSDKRKTCIWDVYSTGYVRLGFIQWRSSWRAYVFHPCRGTIFNAGCLRDIADFLDKSRKVRRGDDDAK